MPTQNRRRNSTYNRRRRTRRKSVFSYVSFWIFIFAVIIIIVLIVKGCDTGKIEADAPPSEESLAPPVVTESEETQNTSDGNNAPVPITGNNAGGTGSDDAGAQAQPPTNVKTPKDNYYKEYDLSEGNYVIGTDLPAGTVDFTAISGTGSISASNGTLSVPAFGTEDGYKATLENMNLYSGAKLSVSGSLRIRVSYVSEPEELSGQPTQNENNKITNRN